MYFGALESVLDAAFRALRPGGLLIFTVEEATGEPTENGYRINPHVSVPGRKFNISRRLTPNVIFPAVLGLLRPVTCVQSAA